MVKNKVKFRNEVKTKLVIILFIKTVVKSKKHHYWNFMIKTVEFFTHDIHVHVVFSENSNLNKYIFIVTY